MEIDSPHCVKSNIFELRKTLHSTDIDAAINHIQLYSSSRTNKTYGIQLDDGSIVDLAGLKNLKFLCKLIESQKEVFFVFFLSGLSFMDTDNSKDSRGRERTFFYSTLPHPPAHEHLDICVQLCT